MAVKPGVRRSIRDRSDDEPGSERDRCDRPGVRHCSASIQTSINTSDRSSARNQAESDTAAVRNRSGGWMDDLWGHNKKRRVSRERKHPAKAQAATKSEVATQPPSVLRAERADGRMAPAQAGDASIHGRHAQSSDATGSISRHSALRAAIRQSSVKSRVRRVGSIDVPLKIGAIVPPTIRLRPLPASVVSLKPAWRAHEFFVIGKEIVIVQPRTSKIAELVQYTE